MKFSFKKGWLIALVVLMVVFSIIGITGRGGLRNDPYSGTVRHLEESMKPEEVLTPEEARQDLDYLMTCLRDRHPAWLDGSGRDQAAEAQYEKEAAALTGPTSVLELERMASGITAALHDSHTYLFTNAPGLDLFLDDFTAFSDGRRPLTMDGVPTEEVFAAFRELHSCETEAAAEADFWCDAVFWSHTLALCGLEVSDGVTMTFADQEEPQQFEFVPLSTAKRDDAEEQSASYELEREAGLGIFTLKSCRYDDTYCTAVEQFFREVADADIHHIVLDLRGNRGGHPAAASEWMRYLNVDSYRTSKSAARKGDQLEFTGDTEQKNKKQGPGYDGEIYVLTDVRTGSAAMEFAMLLRDNDLATLVGETSGSLPDRYGDRLCFQMPNSKLEVNVSFKKWYRVDESRAGEPLTPDIETAPAEALTTVRAMLAEKK